MTEGRGWAWMLEDGSLCHWVESRKEFLHSDAKPSPGAKRIWVAIVPMSWYRLRRKTLGAKVTSANKSKPKRSGVSRKRTTSAVR
jgi:hypothetical protein